MEEWGKRRGGLTIRRSASTNTGANMTDASTCYGKNLFHKHDHKLCKIYAEDKKA